MRRVRAFRTADSLTQSVKSSPSALSKRRRRASVIRFAYALLELAPLGYDGKRFRHSH